MVAGALEEIAYEICMTAKIYGGISSVCRGAIEMMATPLLPAVADGVLSRLRICNEFFHLCSHPVVQELSADEYVKAKITSKPKIIEHNNFVNNLY